MHKNNVHDGCLMPVPSTQPPSRLMLERELKEADRLAAKQHSALDFLARYCAVASVFPAQEAFARMQSAWTHAQRSVTAVRFDESLQSRFVTGTSRYNEALREWETLCAAYQKLFNRHAVGSPLSDPQATFIRESQRQYTRLQPMWEKLQNELEAVAADLIRWSEVQREVVVSVPAAETKEEKVQTAAISANMLRSRLAQPQQPASRTVTVSDRFRSDFFNRKRKNDRDNGFANWQHALQTRAGAVDHLLSLIPADQTQVDYLLFFALIHQCFLLFDTIHRLQNRGAVEEKYMPRSQSQLFPKEQIVRVRRTLLLEGAFFNVEHRSLHVVMYAQLQDFMRNFVVAMQQNTGLTDVYQRGRWFQNILDWSCGAAGEFGVISSAERVDRRAIYETQLSDWIQHLDVSGEVKSDAGQHRMPIARSQIEGTGQDA